MRDQHIRNVCMQSWCLDPLQSRLGLLLRGVLGQELLAEPVVACLTVDAFANGPGLEEKPQSKQLEDADGTEEGEHVAGFDHLIMGLDVVGHGLELLAGEAEAQICGNPSDCGEHGNPAGRGILRSNHYKPRIPGT